MISVRYCTGDNLDSGSEEESLGFTEVAFLLPLKEAEYKVVG